MATRRLMVPKCPDCGEEVTFAIAASTSRAMSEDSARAMAELAMAVHRRECRRDWTCTGCGAKYIGAGAFGCRGGKQHDFQPSAWRTGAKVGRQPKGCVDPSARTGGDLPVTDQGAEARKGGGSDG